MRDDMNRASRLSRRGFLGGIAASAAAAILAACGGSATSPTATPAATTVAKPTTGAVTGSATTGGAATTAPATASATTASSAVAATARPASAVTGTTAPSGSVVAGTTSASATSGGFLTATGPIMPLPPPDASKWKGQTLNMIARQEYFKETETAFNTELDGFAKLTGAKINNDRVNEDTGEVVAKQDAAVKSGSVQDLAYVDRFVAQWYQLGDIVDVSDTVAELEKAYGPVDGKARIDLTFGGKWYGIPYFSNTGGVFARKDWLDEKGIKTDSLKTWENMRDAALEISDPSKNRFGWGYTVNKSGDGNGLIQDVMHAWGASLASDDGQKVTFNSPETLAAITWLADIYTNAKWKNMLPPGVNSWTDTGNNEAWLAGTVGFTQNQFTLYAKSKADKNPVYEKTITFPGFVGPGTDNVLVTNGWGAFVIFKNAKNPDLAKELAKYLVVGSPLLNVVKPSNGLILPAYRNIWDADPYYSKGDQVFDTERKNTQKPLPIKSKTGFSFPQTPSPGNDQAVNGYVLTDMMGDIILKGTKVADAVKAANDRIVAAFNQLGIKQ